MNMPEPINPAAAGITGPVEPPVPDSVDALDAADAANAPDPAAVRKPVDVRSTALVVLAALALLFTLRWASVVFIPLLLGLMFSYALGPLVDRMQRARVPRAVGAGLLLIAIVGGWGWAGYALSDDAEELLQTLPEAVRKVRDAVRQHRQGPETAIDKVQRAATHIEQAAREGSDPPRTNERGVARVRIEPPRFDIRDYLWTGTVGLLASIGQATMVIFITFFLLVSGDTFRRKLVRIAGPTFAQKRITVQTLDEITQQIQRYMLVQVVTSVALGVATWATFLAIGLDHAAVWGVLACLLNFVPYVGAALATGGAALAGFMQFDNGVQMAMVLAAVSVVLHIVSGYLMFPWLTSRTSRLNTVSVFVGVLVFGWLWGMWGLVLGVPVLMMTKAVCDRIDDLKPVGELLGA